MSRASDNATLLDILSAARRVVSFIESMDEAAFHADFKTPSAVQHQPLIMGEAVKRLSPEVRTSIESIPWSAIARMRDRMIHGYDTVDLGVVWRTASRAVPSLIERLSPMLPTDDSNPPE